MKEFDIWNEEKKNLDARESYMPHYKVREIRWCHLGVNVGYEQDGKGLVFARPALVIKGFNKRVCLIVPLTSTKKENMYYIKLGVIGGRESVAVISQLRLIDTRRFGELIAVIDKNKFEEVKNKIRAML